MDPRGYIGTPFNTSQNRQNCLNQKNSTPSPLQGWGAPARGYSPYTCNFAVPQRSPRESLSPAQNNYRQRSPRTHPNQFKYPSPNDPWSFRTPFSPPGADQQFRGSPQYRGRGRKSFNNYFGKSPRHDCNPGASPNIENYYHPDMLEDPWKNCKPVPVKSVSNS